MTRAERSLDEGNLPQAKAAHLAASDFSYYAGSSQPTVRVVEFLDFQCPYCKQAVPTVASLIKQYEGVAVQFSFRHFPIESTHPVAFDASLASLCAKEQNLFMPYHDILYEHQDQITPENLPVFAAAVGLDMERYSRCMADRRYASTIRKDQSDGVSLGIVGTPTFFINGIKVEGAQEATVFQTIIDKELRAAALQKK